MAKDSFFKLPLPRVLFNGKDVTPKQPYVSADEYENIGIPSHVDVDAVMESLPHEWDGAPVKGTKIKCSRCGYVIEIIEDDVDMEYLDIVVPCDQIVLEGVMDT